MKNKLNSNKAITLVALVITIVILLILAGITIAQLSNSGLFDKSKQSKEESENAIEKEETEMAKYENEINNYVSGNREGITLTQEEYEMLKPKSFGKSTLILSSYNNSCARSTFYLNSFSNTFDENYEKYLTYDGTTGDLTVNESGWYFFNAEINNCSRNYYTSTQGYITVNGKSLMILETLSAVDSHYTYDCNSLTLFLEKDDVIKIMKRSSGDSNSTDRNVMTMNIYKL